MVKPGIQGTFPAWNFLQCHSAAKFAIVNCLSVVSRLSNCAFVNRLIPSLYTSCSWLKHKGMSMAIARYLLYFCMILGSWHFNLCPAGHWVSCSWSIPKFTAGMPSHTTQWLLMVTLPKARNPPFTPDSDVLLRNMPLLAFLPCWCVGTGDSPYRLWMASTRFISWQNCKISFSSTLSCMSASRIVSSPASVHSLISWLRSWRNHFLGHVHSFCFAPALTCCWYVVRIPSNLHAWYADTILIILLSFPHNRAQHHHPRPTLLSPGHCALCDSWFMITTAVPPGWYGALFVSWMLCVLKSKWPMRNTWRTQRG